MVCENRGFQLFDIIKSTTISFLSLYISASISMVAFQVVMIGLTDTPLALADLE